MVIIDKLITYKTLFLIFLSQVIKLLINKIYNNYPIKNNLIIFLIFNNLKFTNKIKLAPLDNSLIYLMRFFYILIKINLIKLKKLQRQKCANFLVKHFKNKIIFIV